MFGLAFACTSAARSQDPPAPIRVAVDATEAPRKILHARLVIPAKPGALTLVYPKWIPGEHMPSGPITNLAGLKFSAAGKPIAWRRDLVDMYAFHIEVPEGAEAIEVALDFLLAPAGGFTAGASASSQLDVLSWNNVLLYPQSVPARELTCRASLRLPEGWKFGTALPVEKQSGSQVEFAPVSLETLVDSPVIAGAHFRVIPLTPGENPAHEIDIAADSAAALEMSATQIAHVKQLVAETGSLFGARHYRDYHFLLALSDFIAHFGLEHHESSDNRLRERSLMDDTLRVYSADLFPHEFTHSWNGKYRRPADLATPDYQQPMKDDLLWVYEGLTEYLGDVLTARSGLWTTQEFLEHLAYVAATLQHRAGRNWRSLQDTADAASLLFTAPEEWTAWRRSVDFYDESTLVWLDVDTTLRRESKGRRSMNDFCRIFHGGPGGAPALKTYTFDDVVATLNELAPHDWRSFLNERLNYIGPKAPLGGIENGGWRLVYTDAPNSDLADTEIVRKTMELTFSIGLVVDEDGSVRDVVPGSAAAEAGIGPGMKITGVNGRQFSPDALREAIAGTKSSAGPLDLYIGSDEYLRTYHVDYHSGARFPHLERDNSRADLLSEIIKPLAATSSSR